MAKEVQSSDSDIEGVIKAYSRFVPSQFLELMGKRSVTDIEPGDSVEKKMTILFSDIRDFTTLSESMTPRENFAFINSFLARMEPVIERHNGIIDKYIGDAIMALFPTSADDAVEGAIAMVNELGEYNTERARAGYAPIAIGIGLNTGLMMLGTVGGKNRIDSTVISDAVNLASRLESMTKIYGASLLISEHTYYSLTDAASHDIRFVDRVRVKGKEQPQSVYEVFSVDPPDRRAAKRDTVRVFEEALAHYHFKEVPKALDLLTQCLDACPDDATARVYCDRCQQFMETGVHKGTGEVGLAVEWTPALAVGHDLIDAQHRQLFSRVNDFVQTIREKQTAAQTRQVVGFLDSYVHEHFVSEEECMTRAGYPFLAEQKEQHERFSKYFHSLEHEIEQDLSVNPQFLLFKVQVFVVDWLVHHTAKLDRHFGKFLRLQAKAD